jgi:hypothetical protein
MGFHPLGPQQKTAVRDDAVAVGVPALGDVPKIRATFIDFQKHLYERKVA